MKKISEKTEQNRWVKEVLDRHAQILELVNKIIANIESAFETHKKDQTPINNSILARQFWNEVCDELDRQPSNGLITEGTFTELMLVFLSVIGNKPRMQVAEAMCNYLDVFVLIKRPRTFK